MDEEQRDKDERAERAEYAGRHFKTAEPATEPGEELGEKPAEEPAGESAEGPAEVPAEEPTEPSAPKPRRSPGRKLAIALGVVVLLFAVAAGGAYAWWRHSVEEGRLALTEAARQKAEEGVVEYDGKRYRLNEDVVSVCFIGCDGNGTEEGKLGQSDSLVVLAFDTSAGTVRGISIPRDSMVTVDAYSGDSYAGQTTEQICLQFTYGSDNTRGSELTVNTVSRMLMGAPISYYFTLDVSGIAALNDAVGGVTLTPTVSVPAAGITAGTELTLSGDQATAYVRNRDESATGSYDRSQRQVQYIQAYAGQVLAQAKANPAVLLDLFNLAQQYTYTNLGTSEFSYLADQLLSQGVSSVEIQSLEGDAQLGTTFSEFYPSSDSITRAVLDTFYTEVE